MWLSAVGLDDSDRVSFHSPPFFLDEGFAPQCLCSPFLNASRRNVRLTGWDTPRHAGIDRRPHAPSRRWKSEDDFLRKAEPVSEGGHTTFDCSDWGMALTWGSLGCLTQSRLVALRNPQAETDKRLKNLENQRPKMRASSLVARFSCLAPRCNSGVNVFSFCVQRQVPSTTSNRVTAIGVAITSAAITAPKHAKDKCKIDSLSLQVGPRWIAVND